MAKRVRGKRLIVPEVVQTSATDCGPASLKCLLEGFGISVSYGRLREACQTNVDGTSIDTIEDVALQLGLEAEQTMMSADHVLLPEACALPAIIVISRPNGSNHFVVVWRRHGRFLQIMDPVIGRRWPTCQQFRKELYLHVFPVSAVIWRNWAESDEFVGPLRRRLVNLRITSTQELIRTALADPSWYSIANLDAATRLVEAIVRSGGLDRGRHVSRVLSSLLDQTQKGEYGEIQIIPSGFWSVTEASRDADGAEQLYLRGVVIVRVHGIRSKTSGLAAGAYDNNNGDEMPPLSPELAAALKEPPIRPRRELLRLLKADGLFRPMSLLVALLLATGGVVFEALLFRSLFDIGRDLAPVRQRIAALVVVLAFLLAMLLLELSFIESIQWIGRRIEQRLRIAFLEKLPRLRDSYFHSRLSSDMAERSHSLYILRLLPTLGGQVIRSVFGLALTSIAIAWLDPGSAALAILAAAVGILLPLLAQPLLAESDLRVRTHTGALVRFYLDAMLGLVPIRAHRAERAVRREHESLLAEWARSCISLQRRVVTVEALQSYAGYGVAAWFLFRYLGRAGEVSNVLLLVYWGLRLPFLAQQVAVTAQQYPIYRNITLRLLEPLGAPYETYSATNGEAVDSMEENLSERSPKGMAIALEHVSVEASGHTILHGIDLYVEPGTHIAVIGSSGAGKSTLVGILLGWHRLSGGTALVDGLPLDDRRLEGFRRETVWVDPEVQIWNRSLLNNLRYGAPASTEVSMSDVIKLSQMSDMLRRMPDGLQTRLGEGGALVSGGEGQRVRLGRGMLRSKPRLVILDEPFRGLDRKSRRDLLFNCRSLWRDATLLCITHDISETQDFDRILLVEQGRIIEDGSPVELANNPRSRYNELLSAEKTMQEALWTTSAWRRLIIENGQIRDCGKKEST